jgi:hypothetical protein
MRKRTGKNISHFKIPAFKKFDCVKTDKKEKPIFVIYMKIQNGEVAKSYMVIIG